MQCAVIELCLNLKRVSNSQFELHVQTCMHIGPYTHADLFVFNCATQNFPRPVFHCLRVSHKMVCVDVGAVAHGMDHSIVTNTTQPLL